jgi:hypothetical protein
MISPSVLQAFLPALLFSTLLSFLAFSQEAKPTRDLDLIIVVGAQGEEEYGKKFRQSADEWKKAAEKAGVGHQIIGIEGKSDAEEDFQSLQKQLNAAAQKQNGALWLVLIGHGTFDGRQAKFNLRGKDVTPEEVGGWLKETQREIVLVAGGSASAAFIKTLSGPGRIIVSATKSADEIFYARFGGHFSAAIGGLPEADLDQDKQVSVLEAFLFASRKAREFYENDGRLATEHALIEDNGDGIGTRSEIFRGVMAEPVKEGPKPDGDRARQIALVLNDEEAKLPEALRKRRDEIENEVRVLNEKKATMPEADYYRDLERLMLDLAKLYEGKS